MSTRGIEYGLDYPAPPEPERGWMRRQQAIVAFGILLGAVVLGALIFFLFT